MKKYAWLFLSVFISPSFGEVISDFSNICGTYKRLYAVPKTFTCESGYFLPANAITCYACPNGYTCNGGTFIFSPTRAQGLTRTGYISSDVSYLCSENTAYLRMYAVPRSFTCASGQFLPANATTCYACPSGYTCSGGTFAFSSTRAQGIIRGEDTLITADAHHTCSSNMEHVLNGTFAPNTITINWDDGTNTSTSQCVFGNTFDLPPAPSRPGYVFGGWRVKTNNQ